LRIIDFPVVCHIKAEDAVPLGLKVTSFAPLNPAFQF